MLPEPLPDVFGNYAIKGIAEVLPPDPVAWLPVTPGWRLLGILLLALLLRWGYRRYRHWRHNRYRRLALRALPELAEAPPGEAVAGLATLLKTTAINASSRREIASLSGDRWMDWLQGATDQPVFSAASCKLLGHYQYMQGTGTDQAAIGRLSEEVAEWIRRHRGSDRD